MASGWCDDNAVNEQIADSLADEIERIRNNLPWGQSLTECEECGAPIPEARQEALPGVRLCLECQEETERAHEQVTPYNRKGNKSSQLR